MPLQPVHCTSAHLLTDIPQPEGPLSCLPLYFTPPPTGGPLPLPVTQSPGPHTPPSLPPGSQGRGIFVFLACTPSKAQHVLRHLVRSVHSRQHRLLPGLACGLILGAGRPRQGQQAQQALQAAWMPPCCQSGAEGPGPGSARATRAGCQHAVKVNTLSRASMPQPPLPPPSNHTHAHTCRSACPSGVSPTTTRWCVPQNRPYTWPSSHPLPPPRSACVRTPNRSTAGWQNLMAALLVTSTTRLASGWGTGDCITPRPR